MRYVFLALLMIAQWGYAKETWLCTEDSSQVQGSLILACGVGNGANEMTARQVALKNAQNEFRAICDEHTECGQHRYKVTPSRSTCEKSEDGWKCYRLIQYREEKELRQEEKGAPSFRVWHYEPTEEDKRMDENLRLSSELLNKQLRESLK